MTEAERKIVQEALSSVIRQMGWVSRFSALLTELGCGVILGGLLIFLVLAAWGWLTGLLHRPGLFPTTEAYRVFPCRQLDLVYAPNSRVSLDDLVCLGERFEEWPTYSPDWETYRKMDRYPEDGDILLVSLDSLGVDLARWGVQQEQSKT